VLHQCGSDETMVKGSKFMVYFHKPEIFAKKMAKEK